MVTLTKITRPEDAMFQPLIELYTEAFPLEERREIKQLQNMLQHEPAMFFNAVSYEGKLAGLFVYWNFGTFYYLEHLAVYADMRNKKIGQQILDWVKENLCGIRLLEVEPAETEMATRRVNYYRRNGYHILDKTYKQPSYRPEGEEFPLWIMGNDERLPADALKEQVQLIKNKVYYRH